MEKSTRRARIKELSAKLKALTPEQRQEIIAARGIINTIEGRVLSTPNTLMCYFQCDGMIPTIVGGYQQWKRAGKQVKRGEHGMIIFFPCGGERDEETGDVSNPEYYSAAIVFDVSQVADIEEVAAT